MSTRILAFPPLLFTNNFLQDLQKMSVVVCEKIIVFSLHSLHCIEIKLLFGFGINKFSLRTIITTLWLYFQFSHSHAFFHGFSLAIFTCITKRYLFRCFSCTFQFWEFLTSISFFVLSMPSCPFSCFPIFAFFIYRDGLYCMNFTFGAKFFQLLLHLHYVTNEKYG